MSHTTWRPRRSMSGGALLSAGIAWWRQMQRPVAELVALSAGDVRCVVNRAESLLRLPELPDRAREALGNEIQQEETVAPPRRPSLL
jgi:hypothetical protein